MGSFNIRNYWKRSKMDTEEASFRLRIPSDYHQRIVCFQFNDKKWKICFICSGEQSFVITSHWIEMKAAHAFDDNIKQSNKNTFTRIRFFPFQNPRMVQAEAVSETRKKALNYSGNPVCPSTWAIINKQTAHFTFHSDFPRFVWLFFCCAHESVAWILIEWICEFRKKRNQQTMKSVLLLKPSQ